jgi:hypothetical protein
LPAIHQLARCEAFAFVIGISATRQGNLSVCTANDDTVRVFHASAALGSAWYTHSPAGWITQDTEFTYGMRTPVLTDTAREERRTYLAQHGWLGGTIRMGDGRMMELQISLDVISRTPRLALGYFVMNSNEGRSVLAWPDSLNRDDSCADDTLVRGHVPRAVFYSIRRGGFHSSWILERPVEDRANDARAVVGPTLLTAGASRGLLW